MLRKEGFNCEQSLKVSVKTVKQSTDAQSVKSTNSHRTQIERICPATYDRRKGTRQHENSMPAVLATRCALRLGENPFEKGVEK